MDGIVNIPLLNKEDVEKEGDDIEDKDIREQIIEFLKSKGYKHMPGTYQAFTEDTSDLFVKDEELIEVIVCNDVQDDTLGLEY